MALWGDSPRFEHPEDAKQAVQKLIQEREDLKRSTTALEDLIGNQKQVLEELEMQVDAAQRRAADAVQQAKSKMEELQAQDAELAAAKSRFNMALHVFSLEKDFLKLSQRVGRARQSLFPPPLVISGPSAVGKASLISRLFQDFPDSFSIPISHTSREPQEAEQNGVHFIFISREYMEKAMAGGSFVEVAEVDGDLYGTSIQAVSKVQGEGKVCVLHIDLAGVEQLRQSSLQPVIIWIEPPSLDALKERLIVRGTTDESEVADRLAQAEVDMARARENPSLFDHALVNDHLSSTYRALHTFLAHAYPHLRPRMRVEPEGREAARPNAEEGKEGEERGGGEGLC